MMSFRPHDLLWVPRDSLEANHAGGTVPEWVLRGVGPVVVRRAEAQPGWVPVGVRGPSKAHRFAAFAPTSSVVTRLDPFSLASGKAWQHHRECYTHPVLRTLNRVATSLDESGLKWGITGSLGYELATWDPQLGADSDLDLLIDMPKHMGSQEIAELARNLNNHECRVDVQIETAEGAVSLTELARFPDKVLIKTSSGPRLTAPPCGSEAHEREDQC